MTKEEAIKELQEIRDYVHAKQDNDFFEADTTSLEIAIEALKAQQWIPYSERLPEERSRCLVTVIFEGEPYIDIDDYYCYGWDDWGEKVLAWMPLPEPYKGEEE